MGGRRVLADVGEAEERIIIVPVATAEEIFEPDDRPGGLISHYRVRNLVRVALTGAAEHLVVAPTR